MKLTIVIVNWNTGRMLANCLESIYSYPPGSDFEVVVVDNASIDDSASIACKAFPQIRLFQNAENAGFARANNQAINSTSSELILLLNPDVIVLPGSLTALVAAIADRPKVGVVGGELLNPDGSFQSSFNDFPGLASQLLVVAGVASRVYGPYFPSHGPVSATQSIKADWVGGACILVRRKALEEVGKLDEDYFLYGEEVDLCFRMWKAGWEVRSLPAARFVHWGGQSSRHVSSHTASRLAHSSFIFFRKHSGILNATAFRLSVIVLALAKSMIFWAMLTISGKRTRNEMTKVTTNLRMAAGGLGGWELVDSAAVPTAASE